MNQAGEKRFRVLLISDTYPPVLGGSEIEAQRVCAALLQRKHRVQVLCAGGGPMPALRDWVDPYGVPVTILTRTSRGRWRDITFALRVAWTIWNRRKDTDIVYFLMQGLHLATGLPVARFAKLPIVMKMSGSIILPLMRASRTGRLELRWLRQWAARIMVLNYDMVADAEASGFPRKQLLLMPNPVDIVEFRPPQPGEAGAWRRSHDIPEHAGMVVYVGRLSREKGLRELLRGFAHAARSAPETILLLVGDGDMRPELEKLGQELGLSSRNLRFIGRVPVSDVNLWLRASDIFALTSPSEGFSCALLEAMSVGLASVVSHIPANLQLLEPGVHGLTVDYTSDEAIGNAMLRLLRDPAFRRQLGDRARLRVVENFSTDQVLQSYEQLFAEVSDDRLPR